MNQTNNPEASADDPAAVVPAATESGKCDTEQQTRTVLLVDDDPDYLYQQKVYIESAGFQVITAETEDDAIKLIAEGQFDLAVVDLMMENLDAGFMLCHHIKKRNAETPVVLVTAVNKITGLDFDTTTEEERSWLKADAMLEKPIRFEQLKLVIDRLLQG